MYPLIEIQTIEGGQKMSSKEGPTLKKNTTRSQLNDQENLTFFGKKLVIR